LYFYTKYYFGEKIRKHEMDRYVAHMGSRETRKKFVGKPEKKQSSWKTWE
jgi:hypothetical protein